MIAHLSVKLRNLIQSEPIQLLEILEFNRRQLQTTELWPNVSPRTAEGAPCHSNKSPCDTRTDCLKSVANKASEERSSNFTCHHPQGIVTSQTHWVDRPRAENSPYSDIYWKCDGSRSVCGINRTFTSQGCGRKTNSKNVECVPTAEWFCDSKR